MLKLVKKGRSGEAGVIGKSINDEPDPPIDSKSWCVKHSPKIVKEMAMHHSKIKAIRDWLTPVVEPPGKIHIYACFLLFSSGDSL